MKVAEVMMAKLSRRALFGLAAGAAAAPLLPNLPVAALPPVNEDFCRMLTPTARGWISFQSVPIRHVEAFFYDDDDVIGID